MCRIPIKYAVRADNDIVGNNSPTASVVFCSKLSQYISIVTKWWEKVVDTLQSHQRSREWLTIWEYLQSPKAIKQVYNVINIQSNFVRLHSISWKEVQVSLWNPVIIYIFIGQTINHLLKLNYLTSQFKINNPVCANSTTYLCYSILVLILYDIL